LQADCAIRGTTRPPPPAPPLCPRPDRPGTWAGYCAGPISFWAK
jgi:hypothetical protein